MITRMESTTPPKKRRNRPYDGVSESFVPLQTRVPPWVREHFRAAAKAHGMSLSRYLEALAKADPLTPDCLPGSEPEARAS